MFRLCLVRACCLLLRLITAYPSLYGYVRGVDIQVWCLLKCLGAATLLMLYLGRVVERLL